MEKETLSESFDAMRFDLERSIRYWSSRSVIWSGIVQASSIFAAISGSAAVAAALNSSPRAAALFGALAALLSILSASFDAPSRCRFCIERVSLYTALLADCPDVENETPELYKTILAKRLDLEAAETVVLECLDVACHNKVCRAMGRDHDIKNLSFIQRTLGRILPLPY